MAGSATLPTHPKQAAFLALATLVSGYYGWRTDPERAGPGMVGDAYKKQFLAIQARETEVALASPCARSRGQVPVGTRLATPRSADPVEVRPYHC